MSGRRTGRSSTARPPFAGSRGRSANGPRGRCFTLSLFNRLLVSAPESLDLFANSSIPAFNLGSLLSNYFRNIILRGGSASL
jgi:hypothetical protein